MRLTLVIASLAGGGAERVMAILANEWSARGHHVTLITLAPTNTDRHPLTPAVARVGLDVMAQSDTLQEAVRRNVWRLRCLRRAIRLSRPDVVISFLAEMNTLTLAATRRMGVPVIVSERVDPRVHRIPAFWAGMRDLLYHRAAGLVVQTSDLVRWAERRVPIKKIHVIPNPIPPEESTQSGCHTGSSPRWLIDPRLKLFAVGRLTRQKGFDLLLQAFAACHPHNLGWSLTIFGDGEERVRLEALVVQLQLESAVSLPGYIPDARRILRRGDLFVLPSRYEGFPNALLEAMACGLPVISTDCPSGPREIIRNGVDGLLVPPESVDALSASMRYLMSAPQARQRLAARAVDVAERFSLQTVTRLWTEVLTKH